MQSATDIDVVSLTRRLVEIDTTNPPGNEARAVEVVAPLLTKAGFNVDVQPFAENRSNIIASFRGRRPGPALCFTGHLDTVPLGAKPWNWPPFAGVVEGDRMYGRGTTDMKGGVAAFICAALELIAEGPLERDLVFVITAGEECGCEGMIALRDQSYPLRNIGAYLVAEPTNNNLSLGHKGGLFLALTSSGVTAHSSMPDRGSNAIYTACEVILRLRDLDLGTADHPILGYPTRNVGVISGGHAVNAVPDRARFTLDVRTIPGMDHQTVLQKVTTTAGPEVSIEVLTDLAPVWTSEDDPFVACCRRALGPTDHRETLGMPFFTDAAVLQQMCNAPVVIIGPGAPEMAHRTDEWVSIARLHEAQSIYRRLISEYSKGLDDPL